jgi:NAD(P)-dependent dehydrogenase (short-subunit alcohol dehydrogenase family)
MNPASRSILITGCSSGIGYCAAQTLAKRGYRVFATARKHEDVQRLRSEGLEALQLDLDDSASIARALSDILGRTGDRLDALFNNGAYGQPGAVEDLRREVLRAQFETNLFGTMELTNRVVAVMRRQGYGRIVQNSSVLGLAALPYRGAYNAAKFALEGITDTLRLELSGSGIHVALIEPGPIKSRFRANAYAAYERNIDRESSVHRQLYAAMERRLTKQGPGSSFTLAPDAVVAKLIHAIESPRPRIRYYVTFPTYLFAVLRRILPYRALDWVMRKVSEDEHRE